MNISEIINHVVEKLKVEYNPEKIFLFGSYAWGKPTDESDVDILIIKDTAKNTRERFVEVKKIIYDPEMKVSIMPIIATPGELNERITGRDGFIIEILEKGKLLYAK
jgi:predicted nucleotidyltransferase